MTARSVDKISIQGFKSIKSVQDFELKPLNVLIGPNGSGKSNLIQAFALLNQIVAQRLKRYSLQHGGARKLFHFGPKRTKEIRIELEFGKNGYVCSLVPAQNGSLVFSEETCWYHKAPHPTPFDVSLGRGHDETRMLEEAEKRPVVAYVLESVRSWTVYHFHDTSDSAGVRQACDLHDNRSLRADASNLAAFLYLLKEKHPLEFQEIVGAIRLVAPFFDGFSLEPEQLEENAIRLEWKHASEDAYFDANSLSDGTLRFICLATLLLQPHLPPTVLLDEPELGLHPAAITLLGEMIRAAAQRTQLIISTQSVTFVNQFMPQDIVVVEREGESSNFKRVGQDEWRQWLEDYGVGDLWEKNLFGGRP